MLAPEPVADLTTGLRYVTKTNISSTRIARNGRPKAFHEIRSIAVRESELFATLQPSGTASAQPVYLGVSDDHASVPAGGMDPR